MLHHTALDGKMPRKDWKSVSLSDVLMEEIEQAMKEKPKFWHIKADFITYAVRRLIEHGWYSGKGKREEAP